MALRTANFVFIHVPKTGGTACRQAIQQVYPTAVDSFGRAPGLAAQLDSAGVPIPEDQHTSASAFERRNGPCSVPMIGFVRHPLTWYRSMWSWAKETSFGSKIESNEFAKRHWLAGVWSEDFEQFIDRVLAMQVPRAWVVFHEKLTRSNGELASIGKYEHLAADLFRLAGVKLTAPASAQFRASSLRPCLTPRQEKALRHLERDTLLRWYCD